ESCRLHNRQIGGFLAFEEAAGVDPDLPPRLRSARTVNDQTPPERKISIKKQGRGFILTGKTCKIVSPLVVESGDGYQHCGRFLGARCRKSLSDLLNIRCA